MKINMPQKKFDNPFFVTNHSIERFQERIDNLRPNEIIHIIQEMLQDESGLIEVDVYKSKLINLFRKDWKGKPVYLIITHNKGEDWPTVLTVLGEESIIHGKYVRGYYDGR